MSKPLANKSLTGLQRRMRRAAILAINRANPILAREIRQKAPRDTGALANSIDVVPATVNAYAALGYVVIRDEAAIPNEYGTDTQSPQPFIRPAIAATRGPMASKIRSTLKHL